MRSASLALGILALASFGCRTKDKDDSTSPVVATETENAAGEEAAPANGAASSASPAKAAPRPEVDLDGRYHAPAKPSGTPDAYAARFETRVYPEPVVGNERAGQLRAGAPVFARGKVVSGAGCEGGFLPIVPHGYVCKSDLLTDPNSALVRSLGEHPADASQRLPYMYGTVKRGGPAYARLPQAEDLAKHEPNLASHLDKWRSDSESGAGYGLDLWLRGKDVGKTPTALDALDRTLSDPIPEYLRDGAFLPNPTNKPRTRGELIAGQVSSRNGVAFLDTFLHEGRRYGVSTEMEVMPVDRFRPIQGSDFHGVHIGEGEGRMQFPFALIRRSGGKYKKVVDGQVKIAGEVPYRAALKLTGKQQFFDKVLHYETADGLWVDDRTASRLDLAKKMPGWAKAGEKWMDMNITKQVLMLYEGQVPVYATLVSTGEAGLDDPATSKATTRGIFRVHTKYRASTMSSAAVGEEFELRDVPYVQYFEKGYALHAAYWHDMFGTPKSHGCINLAPEDARRVFFWTDPPVPSTWHGAAHPTKGTVIFVHQ